ncbi:hypothetical protein [Streptacidiphilus sp. EB129]|uniref:hypothetical protein n=1 Tax=Streptacidiphilus sp. EB129 TaxID=3156262 RepID=UPI003517F591
MHLSGRGSAAAVLAAAATLLVGGCTSSGGKSAAGAPTPVASATSSSSGSGAAPGTPTGPNPSDASGPSSSSSSSAGAGPDCRNLPATAAVKAAVTAAYQVQNPVMKHIQPAAGSFYYGSCGTTQYAATRFAPAAGAGEQELVGLQDDGSTRKYFTYSAGGWTVSGSDGFPSRGGCSPQIPGPLAGLWNHCPPPS